MMQITQMMMNHQENQQVTLFTSLEISSISLEITITKKKKKKKKKKKRN